MASDQEHRQRSGIAQRWHEKFGIAHLLDAAADGSQQIIRTIWRTNIRPKLFFCFGVLARRDVIVSDRAQRGPPPTLSIREVALRLHLEVRPLLPPKLFGPEPKRAAVARGGAGVAMAKKG